MNKQAKEVTKTDLIPADEYAKNRKTYRFRGNRFLTDLGQTALHAWFWDYLVRSLF